MALKFNKKYFLVVESISYLMKQKFLGYHYSVIYKKLHKHSHWGTQETLTVTQETLKWRYRVNVLVRFDKCHFSGTILAREVWSKASWTWPFGMGTTFRATSGFWSTTMSRRPKTTSSPSWISSLGQGKSLLSIIEWKTINFHPIVD